MTRVTISCDHCGKEIQKSTGFIMRAPPGNVYIEVNCNGKRIYADLCLDCSINITNVITAFLPNNRPVSL